MIRTSAPSLYDLKKPFEFNKSLTFDDFRPGRSAQSRAEKTLFVLHYLPYWQVYYQFLVNVRDQYPKQASCIDLQPLNSIQQTSVSGYNHVVFFYHDPLLPLYPEVYEAANRLERFCDAERVPLRCRPDGLCNTSKSKMSLLWQNAGLPCARQFKIQKISDVDCISRIRYPVFLRYDAGHDSAGRRRTGLFHNRESIQLPSAKVYEGEEHFSDMVITEFIETRCSDGYYRKYRSWIAGGNILNGEMLVSEQWFVHRRDGILNEACHQEMLQFATTVLPPDQCALLIKANKVLGLDFSGIDWSYDREGNIILWEANAYPSWGRWEEHHEAIFEQSMQFLFKAFLP